MPLQEPEILRDRGRDFEDELFRLNDRLLTGCPKRVIN